MTNTKFPSVTYIIDCLKTHYAIEPDVVTRISEGADMNSATYKVQARNESYFVKINNNCANDHTAILALLHDKGIQQVIPPIKTTHSSTTFSLIVYPFVDGINGFSRKLTDEQWTILGKALKQVHDFKLPSSLLQHIKHETYSPKWRQAVRLFYQDFKEKTFNSDFISVKFLHFMNEHEHIIQHLVNRAEQLSDSVKKQSTKFVLCHSDIHGGNVLIDKDGSIYIVDWDEPIMAPKERDLMFIGGGVANVWNDPQEEVSFYKGYKNTDINIELLSYYRHERIVQDIAEYAEALLVSKSEDRNEMLKQFISMFDPQGVVDMAFKADTALRKSGATRT